MLLPLYSQTALNTTAALDIARVETSDEFRQYIDQFAGVGERMTAPSAGGSTLNSITSNERLPYYQLMGVQALDLHERYDSGQITRDELIASLLAQSTNFTGWGVGDSLAQPQLMTLFDPTILSHFGVDEADRALISDVVRIEGANLYKRFGFNLPNWELRPFDMRVQQVRDLVFLVGQAGGPCFTGFANGVLDIIKSADRPNKDVDALVSRVAHELMATLSIMYLFLNEKPIFSGPWYAAVKQDHGLTKAEVIAALRNSSPLPEIAMNDGYRGNTEANHEAIAHADHMKAVVAAYPRARYLNSAMTIQ